MEEIIQLTEDLIRFKSTHAHPDGIVGCADFIERYLNSHAVEFQRLDFQNCPSQV